MSRRASVFIVVVFIGAIALSVWASLGASAPTIGDWQAFATLVVLATIAQLLKVETPNYTRSHATPVFFFAGALVLPAPLVILLLVVPNLLEWARARLPLREWYLQPFNICRMLIAAFVAQAMSYALDPNRLLFLTPRAVFAAMAAAACFVIAAQVLMGALMVLRHGQTWHGTGAIDGETLLVAFMLASLGYTVAIAWSLNPWLIVPLTMPLLVVFRAMMVPQLKHEAELSKLKSAFLVTVSHEIRTPMNGVIGMSDLLMATNLTAEQRRYAGIVRDSAHSLLAILNDVLDFSKIDAGKFVIESVDFDLRTLVENSTDLMLGRASEQQTVVLVWVDPRVSPLLRGDPVRLRQVLLNLLSNAIKFTKGGEVVVRVRAEERQEGPALLRFSVQDTGIGISEQTLRRLFQPFSQADESTTRKYGGTGLGLAISKRLVDLMGGEIGVESEEGDGSTFWFTVPLVQSTAPVGVNVDAELRGLRALADIRGRRVLITDSRQTSAAIMQDYLKAWGLQSDVVANGAATLAALRKSVAVGDPYAVVLTDENLADMEVAMIARAMQRQPALAATRLILLSSWSEGSRVDTTPGSGWAGHVFKPIKQLALLSALTGLSLDIEAQPGPSGTAAAFSVEQPVLIVDDNDVNLEVVRLQLRQLGLTTHEARNGQEAVDAVARRVAEGAAPFALVLMDCHMPVMDGYAATAAIRKAEGSGPRLPIVALTANAMQSDRDACLAAGMDGYLTKPVEADELRTTLARWLPTGDSQLAPVQTVPAPAEDTAGPLDQRRMSGLRRMAQAGDPEFLVRLIASFREATPAGFAEIEVSIAADDGETLRQVAHRLKGSAANFGARGLVAHCAALEALGRSGTTEGASELLERARAEYEDVARALAEEGPAQTIVPAA